ncbi:MULTISPECIES: bifunctional precorrin-2 dehydrogenase/sirohydrochlorin ferrochelatase [unclassified Haladaptatus]|uniref:precorrin-2 dehydrogenase/sirohydrochlorin ferrochelatase family protein n=1 Tax=unclassified Haladaptatus TaxID=2622732 RepID=UPI0023E840C8|nr:MULTISPECIES: bifunctional precorrin-2 dehydrogenase/sirohydrochlorin ferrochelatase [unclassified Haladaptatus]
MIPLFHDFHGETVLVFGGGAVGARKARRFAREATVVVVSPDFSAGSYGGAAKVRAAPTLAAVGGWLDRIDPILVVAATDEPALNAAIEDAARERRILVNRTDVSGEREAGSVVVPATVDDDPVTVAISTGASSPALAKYLRERIEADVEGAGEMAELTATLRLELQSAKVAPAARRDAIRAVVNSDRVWKALGSGKAKARNEAQTVIDETLVGGDSDA